VGVGDVEAGVADSAGHSTLDLVRERAGGGGCGAGGGEADDGDRRHGLAGEELAEHCSPP
jgi:hypothetical protein